MKIDGSCHCEHITYEAEVTNDFVGICHCTDCQKLSTGAYRIMVPSQETDFRFLKNSPKEYIKKSDNGTSRIQAFCPECGSHIYATSIDNIGKRVLNIRLGTINQREQFSPTVQIWCRSAQPWAFNLEGIPKIEKQ
jgi:hypothetical protein